MTLQLKIGSRRHNTRQQIPLMEEIIFVFNAF